MKFNKLFNVLKFVPFLCFLSFFYFMIKSLFYPGKFIRSLKAYAAMVALFLLLSLIINSIPKNALTIIFVWIGITGVFFVGSEICIKGIDSEI